MGPEDTRDAAFADRSGSRPNDSQTKPRSGGPSGETGNVWAPPGAETYGAWREAARRRVVREE